MKKIVFMLMIVLLAIPLGWGSNVGAASSDGASWIDNEAKVKPQVFDYLQENAGIATYVYTERDISLSKAEDVFTTRGIDKREEDYLVGTDRKTFNKLLITKDGLIVSFADNDNGIVGIYNNRLPLDDAVQEVVEQLLGPTIDDFNHIHFQHLNAEKFFTASLAAYRSARDIVIPDNAIIHEFTGNYIDRTEQDLLDTDLLKPGNTHVLNLTEDIPPLFFIDDKEISSDLHRINGITITSSGETISINGKGSTGASGRADIKLENKFQKTFTDVGSDHSHYEGITSLVDQGIITGYEDGKFRSWNNIERNHVAVILSRTAALDTPNNLNDILNVYKDVDSNTFYAEQIAAVTKAGIFGGANGYFNPNKPITREQVASVLVSALELDKYDTGKNVDMHLGNVDSSHQENVQILANLGVTNQLDDYRPAEKITRAAFSSLLNDAMKVAE